MLKIAYLLAKLGLNTAENEPSKFSDWVVVRQQTDGRIDLQGTDITSRKARSNTAQDNRGVPVQSQKEK